MKRFTETNKWDDPWFRKLSPKLKCLWLYLCDKCDAAGVIDFDAELATCHVGEKIKESDLRSMGDRITQLDSGKYVVRQFIAFQYGQLSESCPAHKRILALSSSYGFINDQKQVVIPIGRVCNALEEEDKEEDKTKTRMDGGAGGNHDVVVTIKREALPTSPEAIRIAKMFHRRLTTEWDPAEVKAFKQSKPTSEDLDLIEPYYAAERQKGEKGMHRRDMTTFLNNYRGELDRAFGWQNTKQQGNGKHEHAPPDSINQW